MYCRDELFQRLFECYLTTREINTKITLSWEHKQLTTSVSTDFFIYSISRNAWEKPRNLSKRQYVLQIEIRKNVFSAVYYQTYKY